MFLLVSCTIIYVNNDRAKSMFILPLLLVLPELLNILCRMGRFPPVVRTAVPVDGRFEHIVLSCNATSDHAIIWIEKEAQRALDVSVIVYWYK